MEIGVVLCQGESLLPRLYSPSAGQRSSSVGAGLA